MDTCSAGRRGRGIQEPVLENERICRTCDSDSSTSTGPGGGLGSHLHGIVLTIGDESVYSQGCLTKTRVPRAKSCATRHLKATSVNAGVNGLGLNPSFWAP